MATSHFTPGADTFKSDFVLVTALEEEQNALLELLPGYQQLLPSDDDIRTYYQADLPVTFPDHSKGQYRIIEMCLLGMGRVQAATATADALRRWKPRHVILVGIAGGINEKNVQIGDILISDQIVDYELQKITWSGPEIRYDVHRADARLLTACKNFNTIDWQKSIRIKRPDAGKPERHVGQIASGDKVIAFGQILSRYRSAWPKLIGVEMEAGGVATAAFQSPHKPGFFMIRGVSDLADENKNSKIVGRWRPYASAVAAAFTLEFLKSGPVTLGQNVVQVESIDSERGAERNINNQHVHVDFKEQKQLTKPPEKYLTIQKNNPEKLANSIIFHLFCPICQTYIHPSQSICLNCDWQRPPEENLPTPRQPVWASQLNGSAVGTPEISGEAVFCAWGGRSSPGGVTALNRFTGEQLWVHEVQQKVVGGVSAINDRLLFGTLGEEKLYCIRQIDHSQVWNYPVQAEIWGKPVIIEEHVYFGDNAGYVHCVDLQSGQRSSDKWPVLVSRSPSRIWLTVIKQTIFGVTGKGLVFQLNPFRGRVSWQTELGAEVRHAPVVFEEDLYIGTLDGQIIRLGAQHGQKEVFAGGLKNVLAPPLIQEGLLFVGTHQRSLHAFDLKTRKEVWCLRNLEHSVSSRLIVNEGLLIACVNQDAVYGLDAKTGDQLWRFPVHTNVKLMTDPLLHDGILYVGTDAGQVYALPWHLGEYAVIAEWLATRESTLQAGNFAGLAAALTPGPSGRQLQNRATEFWQKSGKPEWVASLLEYTDLSASPETVAVAYEEAGHFYERTAPNSAVSFFYKAVEWYQKANRNDKAQACVDKATRLIKRHHLSETVNNYNSSNVMMRTLTNPATEHSDTDKKGAEKQVNIPRGFQNALAKRKLILFIGQDLSQDITGIPSRTNLANNLTTQFNLSPSLSFGDAALQISRANNRYDFTEFLHETFSQPGLFPQEFHKLLVALIQTYQIKTVITTAYDDLLEQAFREQRIPYNTVIQENQLALGRADRPTLFKLFGDLRQPESLIVTTQDQNRLSHEKEWLIKEIIGRFRQNHVLTIGINQVDSIIYDLFDHSGNLSPSHFFLHDHPTKEFVHTWKNLGFDVLEGEPVQLLRQFIP